MSCRLPNIGGPVTLTWSFSRHAISSSPLAHDPKPANRPQDRHIALGNLMQFTTLAWSWMVTDPATELLLVGLDNFWQTFLIESLR